MGHQLSLSMAPDQSRVDSELYAHPGTGSARTPTTLKLKMQMLAPQLKIQMLALFLSFPHSHCIVLLCITVITESLQWDLRSGLAYTGLSNTQGRG